MARIATVLAIVCAAAGIVLGQAASQEISSVENERARAIARADAAAVARLSGAEFFQIGSDGAVATKAAVTPAAPDSHFSDLKVQVVGAAAVATGVQDDPQPLRFLHVWHRENNAWKAVLVHNTPIGKRAPAAPAGARATAGATAWPAGRTADERAVIATHRALNDAFAKRDLDAYSKLTAANFVRITPDGTIVRRSAFIEAVTGTEPRVDPNHSDFRIRIYGTLATVSYLNRALETERVTLVLVKENDGWKQLITQTTMVAPGVRPSANP